MLLPLLVALTGALSTPPHGRATLVSSSLSAPRTGTLALALHLEMDPDWHVYWRNPGAAGLPPRIAWSATESVRIDSLSWPAPDTLPVPPLMTYGYRDSTTIPFLAHLDAPSGDSLRLTAVAHWQICKEICLLEKQEIHLTLPLRDGTGAASPSTAPFDPDPTQAARFGQAWSRIPAALPAAQVRAALGDSVLVLTIRGVDRPLAARIFPITPGLLDDGAPQTLLPLDDPSGRAFRVVLHRDPFQLSVRPDSFAFVVVPGSSGASAREGRVPVVALDSTDLAAPSSESASAPGSAAGRLLLALAFALLGGLLLNLMPCVLPVLSLKVLDLLRTAGHDRRKAVHHGLAYAAGVVGSFLALAATLLVLRSGGSALGWGFQLQSPPVVAILSGLMLLVACNLWGVFEPGASLANLAGTARPSGWAGSFLTGLTATVVATPCTAPFMGAALGYTLTRPAAETLLVFAFLGIGLAAPVVLITTVPALGKRLPRPGVWMETLKQALGFAMAATATWLGWLLARLSGTDALAPLFSLWLLVALGVWILGKWAVPHRTAPVRWIARGLALALFAGAVAVALQTRPLASRADASRGEELWHPGLTQELRASGKPWFLHFTADWCLSCQVNERNAFADDRVEEAFRAKGIRRVKADWTARDTGIARELERFGRQGIPFYVLSDGKTESVLPEVVTPGIVLKALETIP